MGGKNHVYITNFETDYLLCFNHHDCLLGCGTALTTVPEIGDGTAAKAMAYKKGKEISEWKHQ